MCVIEEAYISVKCAISEILHVDHPLVVIAYEVYFRPI